jgi:hypothetical protein
MIYTKKNLFIVAICAALLFSISFIYLFETKYINNSNLITGLFHSDDYEFSIYIPSDYSASSLSNEFDIVYTGTNGEKLKLLSATKDENYNAKQYGTYKALETKEKYNGEISPTISEGNINNKYIYKIEFEYNENSYIIGFVENPEFIINFDYIIPKGKEINNSLYNILTSIERFEVKEVSMDDTSQE